MCERVSVMALCSCGQAVTKVFKSGKPGKYCSQCMDRQAGRSKGAWRQGDIACACCHAMFTPGFAHQKFCSDQCKYRDRDRRESATGLPRADYLASLAAAAIGKRAFICVQCGAAAARRVGGTNAAAGYTNKYCSLSCRDAAYTAAGLESRLGRGLHSKCFGLYCQACDKPFVSRYEKRACSDACFARMRGREAHALAAREICCEDCSLVFCPVYGYSQATLCRPCSNSRARVQRLTAKMIRRGRQLAANVESVDPIVVFERAGWICQMCGTPTPKEKRGTYEADAPELDHIIALAAGGEHSYRNTQCACRRCNSLKSDRPIDEVSTLLARAN